MRSLQLANNLLRDIKGSVLVEYTIVFPLFILLILGTIDVSYMIYDWALANKAANTGARLAVVSNPVAVNITSNSNYTSAQLQNLGKLCYDSSGNFISNNCYSTGLVVCSSSSCSPNTYGFSSANFTPILTAMQLIYCPGVSAANCRLKATNVSIPYQTNGTGFVGQPGGLPMNVTVSISGMTHQFYFIGPIMSFFGGVFSNVANIPTFATTLTSEDVVTN